MHIETAILDNDPDDLQVLKDGIKIIGVPAFFTSDNFELISKITQGPTVVVLDYYLDHGVTGLDIMRTVLKMDSICHFIFMSSRVSETQLLNIIDDGWGFFFARKDVHYEELVTDLTNKIERAKGLLRKKLQRSSDAVERAKSMQDKIAEALKLLEENG